MQINHNLRIYRGLNARTAAEFIEHFRSTFRKKNGAQQTIFFNNPSHMIKYSIFLKNNYEMDIVRLSNSEAHRQIMGSTYTEMESACTQEIDDVKRYIIDCLIQAIKDFHSSSPQNRQANSNHVDQDSYLIFLLTRTPQNLLADFIHANYGSINRELYDHSLPLMETAYNSEMDGFRDLLIGYLDRALEDYNTTPNWADRFFQEQYSISICYLTNVLWRYYLANFVPNGDYSNTAIDEESYQNFLIAQNYNDLSQNLIDWGRLNISQLGFGGHLFCFMANVYDFEIGRVETIVRARKQVSP